MIEALAPVFLSHEHIFCRFRGRREDVVPQVRAALAAAKSAGVEAIVDVTPYGPVGSYVDLFGEPDIPHLMGCVGFYRERYIDRRHRGLASEELVQVMERQLRNRTRVGLEVACVKVASDGDTLTELEKRIMAAAGRFSRDHNLPIVTHAIRGRRAQVEALLSAGAAPEQIMLSHVEMELKGAVPRSAPAALAADLAPVLREGVMLSITDIPVGRSPYRNAVVQLFERLAEMDLARQVSVSGDARFSLRGSRVSFSRSRDYTVVPTTLRPILEQRFGPDVTQILTHDNAARFFGWPAIESQVPTRVTRA